MNLFARTATAGVLALSSMAMVAGCTDREVAIAAGAVAIGAGAVAIGAATDDDHHHRRYPRGRSYCEGGYRRVCHDFRDYYGRWRRDCREVYDSCARRGYYPYRTFSDVGGIATDVINKVIDVDTNRDVFKAHWAQSFLMSHESATKMVDVLVAARDGDPKPALEMGLDRADFERLTRLELPSDAGLESMAHGYDMDVDSAKAMMIRILAEAKKIKKN